MISLSGGGGGWNGSAETEAFGVGGVALLEGGMGGLSCSPKAEWPTFGGFGGGGGGCPNGEGGGGGGYSGGSAVPNASGEGGYSFVSPTLSVGGSGLVEVEEGHNFGHGSVDILPAVTEGCGCDQLCVVLDPSFEEKTCLCSVNGNGWHSEDNVTKCSGFGADAGWLGSSHLIGTITSAILVVIMSFIICFCLCESEIHKTIRPIRFDSSSI